MIVIPNLFGAYQKGREAAIEANWNDLKNYENIEAMRTRNDREALQLLADQADYNINRSMMRDNGDVSAMATALTRERFHGDVYNARNQAMLGQAQYIAATNAAADGRLQNYANGQLMTTFNNGGTNEANSWVNLTDATARQQALSNNLGPYYSLINDTVGYNIRNGQNAITMGDSLRDTRNETEKYNALTTLYQAAGASAYQDGKNSNLDNIRKSGQNAARSAYINSETGVLDSQNLFNEAQNFEKEARNSRAKQLMDQRTKMLQNIRLAAQSGDLATVNSMASEFGYIDKEIEKLGFPSQRHLVRDSVASALGVVPSTATTQVSPTPATQTAAVQPASTQPATPTQVPASLLPPQPQPSFTPNGAPVGHPAYRPQQGAWSNVPLTRPVPGLWQPQHARQPVGAWTLQGTNK